MRDGEVKTEKVSEQVPALARGELEILYWRGWSLGSIPRKDWKESSRSAWASRRSRMLVFVAVMAEAKQPPVSSSRAALTAGFGAH